MGSVLSWLKSSWIALLVGIVVGRFLLARFV